MQFNSYINFMKGADENQEVGSEDELEQKLGQIKKNKKEMFKKMPS